MKKLYLKIVVAIWAVMILSAAVAVAVLRASPAALARDARVPAGPEEVLGNLFDAASVATHDLGEQAFIDWFRSNRMLHDHLLFTVTTDGRVVYESRPGSGLSSSSQRTPAIRPFTVSRPEGTYQVRIAPRLEGRFGPFSSVQRSIVRAAFQPELLWGLLLVAIPLSVLLSSLIARYLVSPLRVFERAGRQLAAGDLQVRVSSELGRRGDEIAEFASTFDHMAAKIEALVRAHQRLLRDVSHELRTPLARVLAATSLARNSASQVSATEIDRIEVEVDRLNGMIGRLLTYAELDAGEARIDRSALRLDRLVADIVEESRIEADAESRSIELGIDAPCTVQADARLLRSCVENVLRNALRFTPKDGSVDIDLRCTQAACVLTIRDYGPGVPEKDLPYLFKPFYRTDLARAPEFGGYGIGLAIAYKAIELHRGRISARNAADGGLLVKISIPFAG